jgi:hypothetical protein
MESKVKDGNYYVVQSFMIKELKLKGLEKEVYAIIYGFSQAEQKFDGSLQYLADWTSSTKQGVMKTLKSLQEKGLINKEEEYKNSVKFVKYYATEFNGGMQLSLMGGIKQSLPNNINIDNIIDNNIKKKKETELDTILNQIENEKLKETLIEFVKMRKSIKKPMTTHALELLIKKLNRTTTDIGVQIQMLEQSILNGWQDVYELKQEVKQNNLIKNNYTKEQMSGLITDLDNIEV